MPLMARFLRAARWLSASVSELTMWLLVPMFAVSLFEVISRYFFNRPTTWAAAVISILFVVAIVPSGAALASRWGHVGMDAFYSYWSGSTKRAADLATAVMLLAFAAVLAWKASEMAWNSVSIREAAWGVFQAPIYPKKFAFALGAVLMTIEALALIVGALLGQEEDGRGI